MLSVETGFEIIKADVAASALPAGIAYEDDRRMATRSIGVCGTCPGALAVITCIMESDLTATVDVLTCRGRDGCGSDNGPLESDTQAYARLHQETRLNGRVPTPVILEAR